MTTTAATRARPWLEYSGRPSHIPTMITAEEASYLRWIGKEIWTGRGAIVEFGPWLGGSTYCLAAGMSERVDPAAPASLLTFDDFVWRDFFAVRAPGLELAPGDSFQHAYEQNLSEFDGLVRAFQRKLPDESAASVHFGGRAEPQQRGLSLMSRDDVDQPVEILFVDGAKSWPALVHMLRELAPLLIPGHTLTVWQDFKYPVCYWVHLGVAALTREAPGALELVHNLPFNTVAFRLTDEFHPAIADALPRSLDEIDENEGLALIDSSARVLQATGDEHGALVVRLGGVGFLADKGNLDAAAHRFRELERAWPLREPPRLLDDVRTLLEEATGERQSSSAARRLRAYHGMAHQARRVRRRAKRAIRRA